MLLQLPQGCSLCPDEQPALSGKLSLPSFLLALVEMRDPWCKIASKLGMSKFQSSLVFSPQSAGVLILPFAARVNERGAQSQDAAIESR